jgi:hypothetical protein
VSPLSRITTAKARVYSDNIQVLLRLAVVGINRVTTSLVPSRDRAIKLLATRVVTVVDKTTQVTTGSSPVATTRTTISTRAATSPELFFVHYLGFRLLKIHAWWVFMSRSFLLL